MSTRLIESLRMTLHREADAVVPPDPRLPVLPSPQRRNRPRVTVVLAAALVAAIIAASTVLTRFDGRDHSSPSYANPSGGASSSGELRLDPGAPAKLPLARGNSVQFPNGDSVRLPSPVASLDSWEEGAVVRTEDGRILSLSGKGHNIGQLGSDSFAGPTIDAGNNWAIWLTGSPAQAQIHAAPIQPTPRDDSREVALPETVRPSPSGEAAIAIDQFGTAYIDTIAGVAAWGAFSEAGPDEDVELIGNSGQSGALTATMDRIMLFAGSDSSSPTPFGAYDPQTRRLEHLGSSSVKIILPTPSWSVALDGDRLVIVDTSIRSTLPESGIPASVPSFGRTRFAIPIPPSMTVEGVISEGEDALLVDATKDSGERYWLRCYSEVAKCEVANELRSGDRLPTSFS